jgi:murein DD-endopeptidase MepM/ murein hydrolase activator NlpD
MRKTIIILFILLLVISNVETIQAKGIEETIDELGIETEIDNNLEFLNSVTKLFKLESDYKSIEEFINYADTHYERIEPYHNEGVNIIPNQALIKINEPIFIITDNQFYLVHPTTNKIRISTVGDATYKNIEKEYTEIVNSNSKIYKPNIMVTPLNEINVTSPFGYRNNPFGDNITFHSGVDLQADIGESIYATKTGIVIQCTYNDGYGNYIEIQHKDGTSTLYSHCDEIYVEIGNYVSVGTIIGTTGDTGRTTGPHLHYEYRINGECVDPMEYIE